MNKILAIAWKELYTTFRNRNLLLIMFITPILLSTIMGLVFGGVGGDSGAQAFSNMPIAIVNMDSGFDFAQQGSNADGNTLGLTDLEFDIGGETINIGEQLLQNSNLDITESDLSADDLRAGGASFNFGNQLVDILLSAPVTSTATSTTTATATATTNTFNIDDLTCSLTEDSEIGDNGSDDNFGFDGTLDDLLDVVLLDDPVAARNGVDSGEYVAAVIIPAGFSNALFPIFNFGSESVPDEDGAVEVYGSRGQAISATIVRAVVEGITNQFANIGSALSALLNTSTNTLAAQLNSTDLNLGAFDLSSLDPTVATNLLQSVDASVLEPLGCLILPNAGNVKLTQVPLDPIQERSNFGLIMTLLGSAQAIFVSLFTGIFGMNSIYDERKGGTLQRMIVSPMPRGFVLAGKMLGNVITVAAQLLILLISFTLITSFVEGSPTFIWGTNLPLLILAILAISLFVSGVGVFIVGLARSAEQVQFLGPMVASTLGALGGSFGFRLPPEISRFSPVWWGTELLQRIANGEPTVGTPLLVLFCIAAVLFGIGSLFFRRQTDF